MKLQQGFTLIEVMIVVFIIGILAAVALPNYRDYVIRGQIPDATSALSAKRAQMEQWYQDNRTYAGGAPACAVDSTTSKYFDFTCATSPGVVASATGYTIAAIGKYSMAGFTFTIDQGNTKTSLTNGSAPSTWQHVTVPCWITKKGDSC